MLLQEVTQNVGANEANIIAAIPNSSRWTRRDL